MARANPLIITKEGLDAILKASTTGSKLNITRFGISDQKGRLDPERTTTNRLVYTGTVNLKGIKDKNSLVYSCIIPAGLDPFYIREVYLFLDNGKLFAIGQPKVEIGRQVVDYLIYTGYTEKVITLIVGFTNAGEVVDISVIPKDEFEQGGALLDAITTFGFEILDLHQRIDRLEGDYLNFKRSTNETLQDHENRLSTTEGDIINLEYAGLESTVTLGEEIIKLRQELERVKSLLLTYLSN